MRPSLSRVLIRLATLAVATVAHAVTRDEVEALFRPFVADQLALAPDGRHIAYTEHNRDELDIIIMTLETPDSLLIPGAPYSKLKVAVADDDFGDTFSKEKERATLSYLRWATPTRLVFALTPHNYPPPPFPGPGGVGTVPSPGGPIIDAAIEAVDADGKNPRTLITAKQLSEDMDGGEPVDPNSEAIPPPTPVRYRTPEIVGFALGDRDHLLVQARGFLDHQKVNPTELYSVDVHTGKSKVVNTDQPFGSYLYDWQGRRRIGFSKSRNTIDSSFTYRPATGSNRWAPLQSVLPDWNTATTGVTADNYYAGRTFPLGFDPDPNILYVASNAGRDTFGIYAFDLQSKRRTDFEMEDPHVDLVPLDPEYPSPQLVFDEFRGELAGVRSPGPRPVALWRDPELAAAQRTLDRRFTRRTVEILDWSTERDAILLRVTGGTEPGRYFVYRRPQNLVTEIMRRAPWLETAALHSTEYFEFDTAAGVHLTGYVTTPRKPRLNPPPAVIEFAEGFPAKPQPEFDREAQVLAGMGLVVIRVNHRGVGGLGIRHRDGILEGIDRVPVEDALAALDWVAARHRIDRKRVATMGSGFGGYLAVRALQLHPDAFRCAIAANAPFDLANWTRPEVSADLGVAIDFTQEANRDFLLRGTANLAELSVFAHPETLTHPVFQIVDIARTDAIATSNSALRSQLKRVGDTSDYVEVNADYAAGLPAARLAVYERLEGFFNLNLYDYKVKVGPTKEVK